MLHYTEKFTNVVIELLSISNTFMLIYNATINWNYIYRGGFSYYEQYLTIVGKHVTILCCYVFI